MEAAINLILIVIGLICAIAWIHGLVTWDGKGCDPDPEKCDKCPFPCNHHKD